MLTVQAQHSYMLAHPSHLKGQYYFRPMCGVVVEIVHTSRWHRDTYTLPVQDASWLWCHLLKCGFERF